MTGAPVGQFPFVVSFVLPSPRPPVDGSPISRTRQKARARRDTEDQIRRAIADLPIDTQIPDIRSVLVDRLGITVEKVNKSPAFKERIDAAISHQLQLGRTSLDALEEATGLSQTRISRCPVWQEHLISKTGSRSPAHVTMGEAQRDIVCTAPNPVEEVAERDFWLTLTGTLPSEMAKACRDLPRVYRTRLVHLWGVLDHTHPGYRQLVALAADQVLDAFESHSKKCKRATFNGLPKPVAGQWVNGPGE